MSARPKDPAALAGSVFEKLVGDLDWEEVWKVLEPMKSNGRISCDDAQSLLSVMMGPDSDMHLMIQRHPRADAIGFGDTFRCRTYIGGGHYERVHTALVLLAVAIIADRPKDLIHK